ncbi:HNH endonuclease signature motif containing protein [Sphingobium scionense]|uniref:HNH nuclease domain-containing protein n=1 Tax=Sphingobium scionense TaxID=1404341 RepID=A0A7W6PVD9_9SPHN|nr:hypothetical protein [Sphingobium scionense]
MTDRPEAEKLEPCPFWSKVIIGDECWVWTGATNSRGYGNFRSQLAHRVAYQEKVGAIPDGLTIDHLCRNKLCVNPAHLEPVTSKVNTLRGDAPTAINSRKTHCSNGHELSAENVKIVVRGDGTRRKCRECDRQWKRERRNK